MDFGSVFGIRAGAGRSQGQRRQRESANECCSAGSGIWLNGRERSAVKRQDKQYLLSAIRVSERCSDCDWAQSLASRICTIRRSTLDKRRSKGERESEGYLGLALGKAG